MNTPTHAVTMAADDQKTGMTIAELAVFVQQAMRLDTPPETPVHVALGWTAQIQRITTGPRRP